MIFELIIFFIIINVIAFVHEFGHFYFARRAGIKVTEFGFGLPPRLWGAYRENKKWHFIFGPKSVETEATIFSVNWLPFGAYNNINSSREEGRNNLEPKSDDMDSKSLKERLLVALGGVLMNILFAIAIFYILMPAKDFIIYQDKLFNVQFPLGEQTTFPAVSYVEKDSPAQKAGIKAGDLIVSGSWNQINSADNFLAFIKENQGKEITIQLGNIETDERRTVKVTPLAIKPPGKGALGVGIYEVAKINYGNGLISKLFSGFLHALNLLYYIFAGLFYIVRMAFARHDIGILAQSSAGPMGLFAIVKITIASGFYKMMNLVALISLAIGATNLLPLPALDGGRICFLAYEALAKQKAPVKLEYNINLWGLFALILLSIVLLFKDYFQFKDIILK